MFGNALKHSENRFGSSLCSEYVRPGLHKGDVRDD